MAPAHREGFTETVENVYLTGFMCSGKTLAGRALARLLGLKFADSDAQVRKETGRRPADIIRREGLAAFRAAEAAAVGRLARRGGRVVALGGGFYPSGRRAALLARTGTTVFLYCPWPELERRLMSARRGRPLLDGPPARAAARAKKLYAARLPFYRRAAVTVDVSGLNPGQAAKKIRKALE